MSQADLTLLQCPKCGNSQQVMVWSSINIGVNPELKEKVMHLDFNLFECEACSNSAFINIPFMYHDMEYHYCVQYYPIGSIKTPEFLNDFSGDGFLIGALSLKKLAPNSLFASSDYIFKPHIVFDIQELVRYVIFREACIGIDKTRRLLGIDIDEE